MKILLAGALALVAGSASAEPFNGPFVGAQAGWTHQRARDIGSSAGQLSLNRSKDSFVGGAFAGYDHIVANRLVLGLEGGFSLSSSDELFRSGRDGSARLDPKHEFDVSARAGYLVDPETLIYVRGGYENVRASVRLVDNARVSEGHETLDGWLVGGGVERQLADHVSARIEYRYSDLGGGSADYKRHQALLGIAYRF